MPARPPQRQKPVALDSPATAGQGIVVELAKLQAINAKAQGPGEVSGPAVAVEVVVRNETNRPQSLTNAVVNLTDARNAPGSLMTGPPAKTFSASVDAGQQAIATYVFTVPPERRNPITVDVSVDPSLPTVLFRGRA